MEPRVCDKLSYQVKQREQENPNKVDQVPIETNIVDWAVVLRMKFESR